MIFSNQSASTPIRSLRSALALLALTASLSSCSGDGGYIDATADIRLEIPNSIAEDIEYPTLVTFSIGYQGNEETQSSQSESERLIFCRAIEPFVYHQAVELRQAACKREDFYVRTTLRAITLDDPDACDDADQDGVLLLEESDYQAANRILADDRELAWSESDCGYQYKEFDMKLELLD